MLAPAGPLRAWLVTDDGLLQQQSTNGLLFLYQMLDTRRVGLKIRLIHRPQARRTQRQSSDQLSLL